MHQFFVSIQTQGRGTYDLTSKIGEFVRRSQVDSGLCHVFLKHTSASLMLCENADPQVREDLEVYMSRLVPDGDEVFKHVAEGPDDMAAHVRSVLTANDLTVPISKGQCDLGTWQGIYLWEHRVHTHTRDLIVTISGEST
tara:strand:- start:179 stop:598 length:420 start_codon:yes stop_codon:yes gene_type:complete